MESFIYAPLTHPLTRSPTRHSRTQSLIQTRALRVRKCVHTGKSEHSFMQIHTLTHTDARELMCRRQCEYTRTQAFTHLNVNAPKRTRLNLRTHSRTNEHPFTRAHTDTHTHARTDIHTHVRIHTHQRKSTQAIRSKPTYTRTHKYTYAHTHTRASIHTNIGTQTRACTGTYARTHIDANLQKGHA